METDLDVQAEIRSLRSLIQEEELKRQNYKVRIFLSTAASFQITMPCKFCTIPSDREYSSETQLLAVYHGASQDSGQGRQTCRHRAAGSIARFIFKLLRMFFF